MRIVLGFFLALLLTGGVFGQVRESVYNGFESWPPEGWEIYTLAAGNGWIQSWQGPAESAHTGRYAAYPSINNSKCNNWLVTPPIAIDENYVVSFWEKFGTKESYNQSTVYISNGSGNPADGDFVAIYETQDTLEDWFNPILDISEYAGDTVFIAFRYVGTFHIWFVDDVAVGPADHVNAALTEVVSPIGVSVDPVTEDVIVRLLNEGIGLIDSVTIEWGVNNVLQEPMAFQGLGLATGESVELGLGDFEFGAEGNYNITASVVATGDIDSTNNETVSSFAVTSIKELRMTGILPESYFPAAGKTDVQVLVENRGENVIDSALIEWYVDGVRQTDTLINDLVLMPGQAALLPIGEFIFERGLHTIEAVANVVGDPDVLDNRWVSTVAVDTFWESFEGRVFPPEGWSIHFGVRDNTNFGSSAHGFYWYTSNVDSNFFGVVKDTIFTPYLEIGNGDHITYNIKRSAFLPTTSSIIARSLVTGDIITIGPLDANSDVDWQEVQIDLSELEGVYAIGIASLSTSFGFLQVDLVSSSASVYRASSDLAMIDSDVPYLVEDGVTNLARFTILNKGSEPVMSGSYKLNLVDEAGAVVASVPGQDIDVWQSIEIPLEFSFDGLALQEVTAQVEFEADEIHSNNTSRPALVNVVPAGTREYNAGAPDMIDLNFPFTGNGNTNSLGEDDLSQTIYYPEDIGSSGNIYGITYRYDNLLESDYAQKLPLRIWVSTTDREDLSAGWQPGSDLVLVFDDTVDILPGFGNDLHIPFETPYAYAGTGNLILQAHVYDPEWPPSILRPYASDQPSDGPIRSISVLDVFDLDPADPPEWFNAFPDHAFTKFAVEPIGAISQLSGTVYDMDTMPIPNAIVEIEELGIMVQTNDEGAFAFPGVLQGEYALLSTAFPYRDLSMMIDLGAPQVNIDIYMTFRSTVPVTGQIVARHDGSVVLPDVEVTASGYSGDFAISDAEGRFAFDAIFEDAEYMLDFRLYGYHDTTIRIAVPMDTLNIGELALRQEAISPYDVSAVLNDGVSEVKWKDPLKSTKETYQVDLDVCSNSYTNEPDERVWLGNRFAISDTTTITGVAFRTDVFDLFDGNVRIDIFDGEGALLVSSDTFTIYHDTLMIVDVPNIVTHESVYAMLYWENNAESTHALCVDFSQPDIEDAAVIRYPGEDIQLLSEFFGGGVRYAFHVRLLTLDKDDPITNDDPRVYNVYRGLSSEFPDVSNWVLMNTTELSETEFTDNSWSNDIESGDYRYMVEAVYGGGTSPGTFSNNVFWDPSTAVLHVSEFNGRFELFPVPATDHFNLILEAGRVTDIAISMFDAAGRKIDHQAFGKTSSVKISRQTQDLPAGVYSVVAYVGTDVITKSVIIVD